MSTDPAFLDMLELLRRAKDGNPDALESLLERYRERLLARVRLMMGTEARRCAESDDFLQTTFLEVVRGLESFEIRDEAAFLRWMTNIARNNIRDSVRRRRETVFDSFSVTLEGSSPGPSPASEADLRDRVHHIAELLERLDEDQRSVIELRDLEGLGYREIGERLGLGASGARMLHTRALVRFGRMMGAPDGD